MKFINKGKPIMIRIGKSSDCHWATLKTGEIIDMSAELGLHYGLSIKTTEGKIGDQVVETKQIETVDETVKGTVEGTVEIDFFKELCSIKGIGSKTAKDIIRIFPAREELIKTIRASTDANALPFRDDNSKVLMEFYN